MDKTDFLKKLEKQIEIHEGAIKDLEEQGVVKEEIDRVKQRRECLINQINLHGGPLVAEKPKQGCSFVELRGGWLIGDE